MQIHADTMQTEQSIGFNIDPGAGYNVEARVRQYINGTGEEYEDAIGWTPIESSGNIELTMPVNKQAVAAGGNTLLEVRFSTRDGLAVFAGDQTAVVSRPWIYITTWTPETRVATICDEKDNYGFGFNGQRRIMN